MKKSSSQLIRSACIIGSTSEVAKSICIELAKAGCKRFHLIARNPKGNQDLIVKLKEGYDVIIEEEEANLLNNSSLHNHFVPEIGVFDLYLITCGSLGNPEKARDDLKEAFHITEANYSGLIPWITAITTKERISKSGRLWVFSSVAGDRGRPSNYHYGAAKAALTTLCEGLLLRCQKKPFSIRIIKAGFMATPMTIGKAPKLLCIQPSKVAKHLLRRPNRRGIEYLPWWWAIVMSIVRKLPRNIASKL